MQLQNIGRDYRRAGRGVVLKGETFTPTNKELAMLEADGRLGVSFIVVEEDAEVRDDTVTRALTSELAREQDEDEVGPRARKGVQRGGRQTGRRGRRKAAR